ATSQKEADELAALQLQSPVKVLRLGVEIPPEIPNAQKLLREQLGIPEQNRVCLFLARVHEIKRLDTVLVALAQIPESPISLVICGNGETAYVNSLKQ